MASIKKLLWLYFWLLIFEGAVRKWVFPHLSDPLLLIRDPVVICIYALSLYHGVFPLNGFVRWTLLLASVFLGVSLLIPDGNLFIMLFGLRCNFFYIPLIFLIPKIFDKADVIKLGERTLMISLPMSILMSLQFMSGADSFINQSLGETYTGAWAALQRVRPSGTFSYTTGACEYFALAAAFLIYSFLQGKVYKRALKLSALAGVLTTMLVAGSRYLIIWAAFISAASFLIAAARPVVIKKMLKLCATGIFLVLLVLLLPVSREGLDTISARFHQASTDIPKGHNIFVRYLSNFKFWSAEDMDAPVFGEGLGRGTNAGLTILNKDNAFHLYEREWRRIPLESGPVLAFLFFMLRASIAVFLIKESLFSVRQGNYLPVLLCAYAANLILIGQWSQATTLGFAALGAGLCLASARADEQ